MKELPQSSLTDNISYVKQRDVEFIAPLFNHSFTQFGHEPNGVQETASSGQITEFLAHYITSKGKNFNNATLVSSPNNIILNTISGQGDIFTALYTGMVFEFTATYNNTGAVNVNIDSIGAVNVLYNNVNLLADYIIAGYRYYIQFNGTNFILLGKQNTKLSEFTNDISVATKRKILPSNNTTNPNTQIDFSIGTYNLPDESNAIYNASVQTGDLSLNFGNGLGMLDTGTKANLTWYYLFAIYNPTTKITKFLASITPPNSTTGAYAGANMPIGYTVGKYIGALSTNASGNIIGGSWLPEGRFEFAVSILTGLSITGAYATYTLNSMPLKSNIVAICNVVMRGDAGQGSGFIYKSLKTLNEKYGVVASVSTGNYLIFEVDLNNLAQFQYRYPTAGAGAPQTFQLYVIGYKDLDLI